MGKTILMCCNAYPPNFIGGAELLAHHYGKALQRQGHQVIVFAGTGDGAGERHSMREEIYDGLTVFRVRLQGEDYRPDYVNFFHPKIEEHFDTLLERFSPDVAHMHNLIGLSTGIISRARARGVKTVLTLHDYWVFCFKNTRIYTDGSICNDFTRCANCMPYIDDGARRGIPVRLRNDFLLMQVRLVDRILSPCQHLADAYMQAGIPASRLRVLWYGVDVERFASIRKTPKKDSIRFTFIGWLGVHKGVQVILDAVRMLAAQGRSAMVTMVGEGDLKPALERRAAELGLQSCVNFAGKVDNSRIAEVFAATDVFILPSLWPENQPISILEAMASHTPVIASRVGGIPELVRDGVDGYLFEPGDAAGLARAMECFLEAPGRAGSMGEAAFESIRNITLDKQVRELVHIYDE